MEKKDLSMFLIILVFLVMGFPVNGMSSSEKSDLRDKVKEMFHHAYQHYMKFAYPADELMPLSCKGRYRGSEPSRGDVDDALGNFSLTLVDTLDSLVVLGEIEEFDRAVRYVIRDVNFDRDIVVSVFETNIRMLGGLLGGHVLAVYLKKRKKGLLWYQEELLEKAKDLGYRLLPSFNTTTGVPFPRVNLRHGVDIETARTGHEKDTCTACAGTMILEFAALSRLSGEPVFEEKARKAMEFLWKQRHRGSDLVGTVINIHNGDWVRRETGVGAGVDSYYEYLLKAYILLGDETYLERFNKHYEAIDKYVKQGPLLVDVHMHKPFTNSRNFMDALLAFWPGLQVLKGDIKPAIETHEMLYQVTQRHNFLPEAFTTDFRVHWGQHPLRPEFTESTYFIYKATADPYYLEVGKTVIESLEKHARVDCGYASIRDVTTGAKEDQMDSFVLAETFKYLYLLFSEKEDIIIDVDDFIFTTEAHLLPLSLSLFSTNYSDSKAPMAHSRKDEDEYDHERSCPNSNYLFPGNANYAHSVRHPLKDYVEKHCPRPRRESRRKPRLRATDFIAGNQDQMEQLKKMGIQLVTMKDGRVQLLHTASEASSPEDAEDGMLFMQDMIELSKNQQQEVQQEPRVVQLMSPPFFGTVILNAGHAQFGVDLKTIEGVQGQIVLADPFKGCQPLLNVDEIRGNIAIMERGECMFIDKARHAQAAEAIAGIVLDHTEGSSSLNSPLFAMSGDGKNDVSIPLVFLFHDEGTKLKQHLLQNPDLQVLLAYETKQSEKVMKDLMEQRRKASQEEMEGECSASEEPKIKTTQTATSQSTVPVSKDDPNTIKLEGDEEENLSEDEVVQLVNKYIERIGGDKIIFDDTDKENIEQDIVKETEEASKESPGILSVTNSPAGSKQLRININKLDTTNTDFQVAQVFSELMGLLQAHTNFDKLGNQEHYTSAINKLVAAALSDGLKGFDKEISEEIDRLTAELKPKDEMHKADLDHEDSGQKDFDQPTGTSANNDEQDVTNTDQITSSAKINNKHFSDNLVAQETTIEEEESDKTSDKRTSLDRESLDLKHTNTQVPSSDTSSDSRKSQDPHHSTEKDEL